LIFFGVVLHDSQIPAEDSMVALPSTVAFSDPAHIQAMKSLAKV
jgi:hypothetical protein